MTFISCHPEKDPTTLFSGGSYRPRRATESPRVIFTLLWTYGSRTVRRWWSQMF